MTLALSLVLCCAGLALGWPAREVIRRLAVPVPSGPADDAVPAPAAGPSPAAAPGSATPRRHPPALAVGLCTAALLAGLAARTGPAADLAAFCWLAVVAVPLAWIDAAVRRLPDVLTAAAYAGTVVLLTAAAAGSGHWGALLRAVLGGLALAAGYLAIALISPSGMGLGDVKLSASLGTAMAWTGWATLARGTIAGLVLAAVYGVALLASGRATLRQHIPLGPFMIAGAFLALLAAAGGS
jgi:leader peptidase (prepilin peptidase) / N-methyltransferase